MEGRRGVSEAGKLLRAEGVSVRENLCLAPYTTMGIGGVAPLFLEPPSTRGMADALSILNRLQLPLLVLGRGSNLLLCDQDFSRVVLFTGGLNRIEEMEDCRLKVGGGAPFAKVLAFCVDRGLSGLEPLAGIPGTLGGMVAMNAGSFGCAIGELVEEVRLVTLQGSVETVKGEEVEWGYRYSSLRGRGVVTEVVLRLRGSDPASVRNELRGFQRRRETRQPLGFPSAGSVFKNPPGHHAGELVERVGLKGRRCGDAAISEVHANFIVNLGRARCADVLELIGLAKAAVFKAFGIELEEEVEYVC